MCNKCIDLVTRGVFMCIALCRPGGWTYCYRRVRGLSVAGGCVKFWMVSGKKKRGIGLTWDWIADTPDDCVSFFHYLCNRRYIVSYWTFQK